MCPMSNPWFRLYSEMVDDAKMRMLSADDRWYFVALLCCKNEGLLDAGDAKSLLRKKLQIKLGLAPMDLEHCLVRLEEVGLIHSETAQPLAWENRQFLSDSSTARVKAYRERVKREGNVTVTAQDTDTDTDTEQKKKQKKESASAPVPDDHPLWADVSCQVRDDFKSLRKHHRAAVTLTALKGIAKEAQKAGWTMEQALELIVTKGWRSFEASWVNKEQRPANGYHSAPRPNAQPMHLPELTGED